MKLGQVQSKLLARTQKSILDWIEIICAIIICFNFSYTTNPVFNPNFKVIAAVYGVWFILTYLRHSSHLVKILKLTWPLLLWSGIVFFRHLIVPSKQSVLVYCVTLLLFVGLAYWYIEQRDFFSIRILMITFIIGWLICSVVSLTLIRIHPNVLRGISSGEFSLEGKYAGAGSFGFVYSLPYICIVLALITFHYLKRYRETKIRLWLVIGCVAAVIDILFFVVLVQAKFIMAYLLFFLGLIMLFIFYGQRIKRLLVVLGAGAIAYVPLAHLLLVVADHTANRFIKVRFYEMGNLMLGRLFLASEQSAILGRGGVFKDILDVIRHYPILGAAGREGQFLFHHDFQWLGDYALYGIFIILPLFFIFFQWYRFIKNKTNDTFCRNQLAAFFFMIGLHGLINRLNANELLATLFIFMPFVIIYFSNLDGVNKKLKIDFKEQADDNRGK